ARTLYSEGLALARTCGDPYLIARLLNGLGVVALDSLQVDEAHRYFTAALEYYPFPAAKASLAVVHDERGEYALARDVMQRHLTDGQLIGDVRIQASTLNNLGVNALESGNYTEALGYFLSSAPMLKQIGHRVGLLNAQYNLVRVNVYQADLAQAYAYVEEVNQTLKELEYQSGRGLVGILEAELALLDDAPQRAEALLRQIEADFDNETYPEVCSLLPHGRAMLAAACGNPDQAERLLRDALDALQSQSWIRRYSLVQQHAYWALLHCLTHTPDTFDHARLRHACELVSASEQQPEQTLVIVGLAHLHEQAGRLALFAEALDAVRALTVVRALDRKLFVQPLLWRLDRTPRNAKRTVPTRRSLTDWIDRLSEGVFTSS
ncbi:MAG: tetratricopeptide repeat protein, partial [Anaerolineae bacterium]|nr:tetratricopeptide repeat protein [Anaerolineae bacterium]